MTYLPDITSLILKEGGFSNHSHDLGGETKYGITKATALENDYTGPISELPIELAKEIYLKKYWIKPGYYLIAPISIEIAQLLFESGVLSGKRRISRYLQRSLNLLNKQGILYEDIKVDGLVGPKTAECMQTLINIRGNSAIVVLRRCLKAKIGEHFFNITEKRPKNESFFFGWMLNRG